MFFICKVTLGVLKGPTKIWIIIIIIIITSEITLWCHKMWGVVLGYDMCNATIMYWFNSQTGACALMWLHSDRKISNLPEWQFNLCPTALTRMRGSDIEISHSALSIELDPAILLAARYHPSPILSNFIFEPCLKVAQVLPYISSDQSGWSTKIWQ